MPFHESLAQIGNASLLQEMSSRGTLHQQR